MIQTNLSQQHAALPHQVKSGLPVVVADPDHDSRLVTDLGYVSYLALYLPSYVLSQADFITH